jgi:hypothetical protein
MTVIHLSAAIAAFLFQMARYQWNVRGGGAFAFMELTMKPIAFAALMAFTLAAVPLAAAQDKVEPAKGEGPPQSQAIEAKPGSEEVVIAPEAKRATPPDGDPRSVGERREDAMAYDKCVLRAHFMDTANPVQGTPEEYCSRKLGMEDRNAVPNSVKTR